MKLYLVDRTDDADYDEYDAIVVRAASAERAREIALSADEYGVRFSGMAPHNIKVTPVYETGEEEVILSSFNAG